MSVSASICLPRSRQVNRSELERVKCPRGSATWCPIPHHEVVQSATEHLVASGLRVARETFGLSRGDARLFAVLELDDTRIPGVGLAVGLRSSIDRSMALSWGVGSRVLVCDNMSFTADRTFRLKHSPSVVRRYEEAIRAAVAELPAQAEAQAAWVEALRLTDVDRRQGDHLLLTAYAAGVLSSRTLTLAHGEWWAPSFPDFAAPTAWSCYNACTRALSAQQQTAPTTHLRRVLSLNHLFAAELGLASPDGAVAAF